MEYISTLNKEKVKSTYAIVKGLAEDGGLFVPQNFPYLNFKNLIGKNYNEIAFEILNLFFNEFDKEKLHEIIDNSYNLKNFETEQIVSIKDFNPLFFLELYHGKTLAFKDYALSLFPYLLKESSIKEGIKEKIVILTATSGDTGKAVLEAFAEVEGIEVVVFYPQNGVSNLQKLQMITSQGKNLHVIAIDGNFDDAQTLVKQIFNDIKFNQEMKSKGYLFTSANSINIARLIPQIIYYFYSYIYLINNDSIKAGEKVNFVVPTGNFGNILACYYAKKMGLPVETILCSSNRNNVLYEFFTNGKINIKREFFKTISPSMDILISSNFERFLYDITEANIDIIKKYREEIYKEQFILDNKFFEKTNGFFSSFATDVETISAINKVYGKYNYLIDPHTATAYKGYEDYLKFCVENGCDNLAKTKTIIVSTASPFKFPKVCFEAIFGQSFAISRFSELELSFLLSEKIGLKLPEPIVNLKNKPILHNIVIKKEEAKDLIQRILL